MKLILKVNRPQFFGAETNFRTLRFTQSFTIIYIIISKYSEPTLFLNIWKYGFKDSQVVPVVKNSPASAGDTRDVSSIPGLGSCPGGGNANNLLQYSCLENVTVRGTRQATVHEVEKSCTQLSD